MSIQYVNNLDDGVYELASGPNSPPVEFTPSLDLPTQFFLGNGQLSAGLHWGDLQIGNSDPSPPNAFITVEPPHAAMQNGNALFSNGAVFRITGQNVAHGTIQSKTAYILPQIGPLMAVASALRATLDFDMPAATGGAATDVWAVALNFKTGTKDDGAADQKIGITCQFSGGGNIRFHGTDYPAMTTDPGTYGNFGAYPLTLFSLQVEITLNGGGPISGTGSLTYGTAAAITTHSGQLKVSPTNLAGASITAAGAAVVTTTSGFTSFGARLRSFSLELV